MCIRQLSLIGCTAALAVSMSASYAGPCSPEIDRQQAELDLILLFGVAEAAAQSCPEFIEKRQTLMKKSGAEAKIGTGMIKGERPFDLAKVQEIYAAFAEDARQMPTLFPDCSKTGHKTTAAPAIWQKMDDFKAAIAKFAADIKAAQDNTKDLDGLKANFQTIGKNCSDCHQTFRVRTS